jgi:hypothetical protein
MKKIGVITYEVSEEEHTRMTRLADNIKSYLGGSTWLTKEEAIYEIEEMIRILEGG